ncbi:NAD(P)/FAD-dependent oxidoreductase [Xanthobacter autotrophicus]|uniref:NAD(P)/FAD-dependent oxidoreductase n=1 Tax=Xanthobacter TaxID=279 RepID=UPI0024AA1092|nr:NAD(P)/FAD-dependent oxidoreductase [Xanthobacter autotrophicus]MDI4664310.1 NAD(P)/FAD-dependent oxidoreductase [Xanthobacter autotrophicus]
MDQVEAIVIGAGVVGLAIARALARAGREVVLIEAAGAIGTGISARNSEVIHAGIYYEPGSLKADLCVKGRDALYAFCASHGIGHSRLGKLIVAASADEVAYLEKLAAHGAANGVGDLVMLDGAGARALEPSLKVHAALFSPSTGIVDSHGLMLALHGDMAAAGGLLALGAPFAGAEPAAGGLKVRTGGDAPLTLGCRLLVNAAGLDAPDLARRIAGMPAQLVPEQTLAKGNYFICGRKVPFSRLIYPVPEPGGLGTHLTLDLGGQGRFGPDVEWVTRRDYGVDPARKAAMLGSIRRYWPDVREEDLAPGYAGIRPKIPGPGGGPQDFVIQGPAIHGVAGLVNLFGIESPGLTSCLAIADKVLEVAEG